MFSYQASGESKGGYFREVSLPASLASKKRHAEDIHKHISKKQNKKRKLIISQESLDDEVVIETPIRDDTMGIPSPMRNYPIKSNFEEIGNSGGSVKESNVDKTTDQGDSTKISTPEQRIVIPPEDIFEL
ncbi:unnamed protein product [Lactuca saligna]|uniref:Uncharacterized protein n=1 Tax=Lactuca saligna TaxID=75948 RepID=A0AA35YXG4_LACSI|nr:unnamed protein product [Lactuca saligna]